MKEGVITAYLFKRLLFILPMLMGITLVSFVLLKALPGDPVVGLVGERASSEVLESIRKELGTDRGPAGQYIGYLKLVLKGDLGRSYYTNRDVRTDIFLKFPNTMRLAVAAMLLAVAMGVTAGLISAFGRGGLFDRVLMTASMMLLSIPVFWSAIIFMLVFSLQLKLAPPSGTGDLRFLVLPAIVLSLPAAAALARVTRTTVLEVSSLPYVKTARAKGMGPLRVSVIHVLKNALIPIVTVIGLDFGSYLNGAVVTESIFGWDGIGRFTMEAVIKRDYPVILGCIITGAVVFSLVNLLTDILYHFLDPRVRLHGKGR